MIGFHLIIDGILRNPIGRKEIEYLLKDLPAEIGMKILAGPLVVEGSSKNPGWTGVVVIEKSHIAIHSFDEGSKASIDVYSCRPFEKDLVIRYLDNHIEFRKVNTRMLIRSEEKL
jgi:S-adenosylmethionine/arginine decarboxylase-like enzyme